VKIFNARFMIMTASMGVLVFLLGVIAPTYAQKDQRQEQEQDRNQKDQPQKQEQDKNQKEQPHKQQQDKNQNKETQLNEKMSNSGTENYTVSKTLIFILLTKTITLTSKIIKTIKIKRITKIRISKIRIIKIIRINKTKINKINSTNRGNACNKTNSAVCGNSIVRVTGRLSTIPGSNAVVITVIVFLKTVFTAILARITDFVSSTSLWNFMEDILAFSMAAFGSRSLILGRKTGQTAGTRTTTCLSIIPMMVIISTTEGILALELPSAFL